MRCWLALLGKPKGRAVRHPRMLEVIVVLSGQPSKTLRINLELFRKAVIIAGVVVFAWFSTTFYIAYWHVTHREAIAQADMQAEKIAALKASNARLKQAYQVISRQMLSLQDRIEQLAAKVRALARDADKRFPVEQNGRPAMGGPALSFGEVNAFVQGGFSSFYQHQTSVLTQLESALEREAARPTGAPLAGKLLVSSGFGLRSNPFGSGIEFHGGMDFVGNTGTPVMATASGKVIEAGAGGAIGNHVAIDHGYGYRSIYGHLSKVLVRVGETVNKGQIIGLIGNTGRSSGPHLHYALQYHGQLIDPAPYVER